jgi:F-type H+-transporting ATPase subunit alpha
MVNEKMKNSNDYGIVTQVRDEIVTVIGLYSVGINERVSFMDSNLQGMVRTLSSDNGGSVLICVLGNAWEIEPGMIVKRTKEIMSMPVTLNYVGRIISPTGENLSSMFYPLLEYIY